MYIDDGMILFFFLWLLLLPCSFSYLPNPLPPSLSRSHSTLPRSHGTPKGNAHESSSPRCKQAHLHLTIDLVHQSVPPLPPPQDKEGYHRLGRKQNRVDLYIGCSLEEVGKAFYCQGLFPSGFSFGTRYAGGYRRSGPAATFIDLSIPPSYPELVGIG